MNIAWRLNSVSQWNAALVCRNKGSCGATCTDSTSYITEEKTIDVSLFCDLCIVNILTNCFEFKLFLIKQIVIVVSKRNASSLPDSCQEYNKRCTTQHLFKLKVTAISMINALFLSIFMLFTTSYFRETIKITVVTDFWVKINKFV